MAYTAISDLQNVIRPNIFAPAVLDETINRSPLIQAGIIRRDPVMDAALRGAGLTFQAGFIGSVVDQPGYTPNTPTDDPNDLATPKKVTGGTRVVPRLERNDHFSFADLLESVTGIDLADELVRQSADMVLHWRQTALLAMIRGAINETNAAALVNTTGTAYGVGGLIGTLAAWGDQADVTRTVLAMNSATQFALRLLEPTAFVPPSQTDIRMTTYMGMPIVVDDSIADEDGVRTIYVIKDGGIRYGVGTVPVPVELQRESLGGNGGGASILGFRDAFGFHIPGVTWTGATVAGNLPTDAELADPANWALVGNARNVGVAAYRFTV